MFLPNANYKLLCIDQIRLVYILFGCSTYTKTEIGSQLLEMGTCHIKICISGFSWEKIREFGDTELTFLMAAISPSTYKYSPFCSSLCLLALVLLLIYFTLRAFIVIEIAIFFSRPSVPQAKYSHFLQLFLIWQFQIPSPILSPLPSFYFVNAPLKVWHSA